MKQRKFHVSDGTGKTVNIFTGAGDTINISIGVGETKITYKLVHGRLSRKKRLWRNDQYIY